MNNEFHNFASLLRTTKNNRKVVCITGKLAAGKTYAMSVIAHELNHYSKLPTFHNYDLTIGQPVEEINFVNLYTSRGYSLICLDEGHSVAYQSRHFIGSLLSEFMKDKNVIVILTAFNENRIDKEIRKKIDVIINVERTEEAPNTIRLSSGEFERFIEIDPSNELYSGFEPARTIIQL